MDKSAVYKVAKWSETYETADSRKHKRLSWVSVPIAFYSNGYATMVEEFGDEAPAIYGAWIALVLIAAECSNRGVLCSSKGIPMTSNRMAMRSQFPASVFEKLIAWAESELVGWLERVPADDPSLPPIDPQLVDNQTVIDLPNPTQRDQTQRVTPNPTSGNGVGDSLDLSLETLRKRAAAIGVHATNCIARAINDGATADEVAAVLFSAEGQTPKPKPGVIVGRLKAIAKNPKLATAPWPDQIERTNRLRDADRQHEQEKQRRRKQIDEAGETENTDALADALQRGLAESEPSAEQCRQAEEHLDAMPEAEQKELAQRTLPPVLLKRFLRDPNSLMARESLIDELIKSQNQSEAGSGRAENALGNPFRQTRKRPPKED